MAQLALEGLRQNSMRVRQVMKQTRARIYRGDTRAEGKIVSLFEPMTEVIRNQRFFCSRFCSGLFVERFGMTRETARNGAPDARAASASPRGDTASTAADTGASSA